MLSWRQIAGTWCVPPLLDTSWVNWTHTAWVCIYLLVFALHERNWATIRGEETLSSGAEIDTPCTVVCVKTVLGAHEWVLLLKLYLESWVWPCFYCVKAGPASTEQYILASLTLLIIQLWYQLLSNAANMNILLNIQFKRKLMCHSTESIDLHNDIMMPWWDSISAGKCRGKEMDTRGDSISQGV